MPWFRGEKDFWEFIIAEILSVLQNILLNASVSVKILFLINIVMF